MSELFLQLFIGVCFIVLILVLFTEKRDYLTWSMVLIVIASIVTAALKPSVRDLSFFIDAIDFEVIIFLFCMFIIVEILNDQKIFHHVSQYIVERFQDNLRLLFYSICVISTLVAAFLEDLSVAIIFAPIIIISCRELKVNPTAFLLGMTICINLASTLTPYGSAENILIVNAFDLGFWWFIKNFAPFFLIATVITLVLLDRILLSKYINERKELRDELERLLKDYMEGGEEERTEIMAKIAKIKKQARFGQYFNNPTGFCSPEEKQELKTFYQTESKLKEQLAEYKVDKKTLRKNLIAIVIFVILLSSFDKIYVPAILGALLFVFINPVDDKFGNRGANFSHYLRKVDLKLLFFFICLFELVALMEVNGTIDYIQDIVLNLSHLQILTISCAVLILTSILSAFMDNAPVTIIFIPIVESLLTIPGLDQSILVFSFILGVNLGGNILPQGSACDMMTLEIAKDYDVKDMNYRKLFKYGALFSLIHIALGVGYMIILHYV